MIDFTQLTEDEIAEFERTIASDPPDVQAAVRRAIYESARYGDIPSLKYLTPPVSLRAYVRDGWHVVEPGGFVDNWHIHAICDHLEAVTRGEIHNLIINVPPRSSKSTLISIMWPSWMWTFRPTVKWLFSSYSDDLAGEHSRKARMLIQSEWYRSRWGHMFHLVGDANRVMRYDNSSLGYRMSTSVNAGSTGFGGDLVCCDDPNDIRFVESDVSRKTVNDWWDQVMSMRLNNKITGARVIIQQRSHQEDLTGHVMETEPDDWERLCIPMEYDPEYKCRPRNFLGQATCMHAEEKCSTAIGWSDPRLEVNELMCPERFPREVVDRDKKRLGSYGTAGQLQQRPAPKGGGMFKRVWFPLVEMMPPELKVRRRIRFWDVAGTEEVEKGKKKDPAYTVGTKIAETYDGQFYVEHVVRGRWAEKEVNDNIVNTAKMDGRKVEIGEEQEPGSSGKAVIAARLRSLVGFVYKGYPASGDKVTRAKPWAAQCEGGNVILVRGPWNQEWLDEYENFPNAKFKDQVDSCTGGFAVLTGAALGGTLSEHGGIVSTPRKGEFTTPPTGGRPQF